MPQIPKEKYETRMIKASDIKELTTEMTITACTLEKLPQTGETYVLAFAETEKVLPLNITNLRRLVENFGDNTDNWINKRVKLIKVLVNNPQKGVETESLRIQSIES